MQKIIDFLLYHTPFFYWTQSLWRDEAFSVWIAQDSIPEAIRRTSGDFNPPLYYVLLHMWMRVFGRSEIALRGLSVLIFLIFLYLVFIFARKLFRSSRPAVFTTLMCATNPMLLYFAFELRMYALVTLLSTLSMYFLYTKNWRGYVIAATLGLYTQPFMVFVLVSQVVYAVVTNQIRPILKSLLVIGLLYAPWIPTLVTQFRASGPMWIYPMDLNLIMAVLGNLYLGYEGTPGYLWPLMHLLSLIIVSATLYLWRVSKYRNIVQFFTIWVFFPLILVVAISLIKPIYVHRYVIFISIGEVFLVSAALLSIKSTGFKKYGLTGFIMLNFLVNFFTPSFHRKVNIRDTFVRIIPQLHSGDAVYSETPLVFYESLYYTPPSHTVFLYNPQRIEPPRYVGSIGMPPARWATYLPLYPERAFIVSENGSYRIVSIIGVKS